ncbi:MAG: polyphosphate polymerase domain-containing protein [Clostridiales bacterium]|nr:polyphosphate polymerase domain-containing protein [Clostridiales bacterium]MDO4350349.1 polyphosphate polymerase domain-containing protein [Eubacteriales bacterium]MDY4008713.1 polyphosphate polymerase domain-containing protein [Candidatus Limiplasma sp.]
MASITYVFERVERKYLLTSKQYEGLMRILPEYMQMDQYGESAVCSLYLDTDDSLLIRRSTEKPCYKEKLRLRSYGVPTDNGDVFWEIKKKVHGVVYKRRVRMGAAQAMECLLSGHVPEEAGQIGREIDYMLGHYQLKPAVYLAYDRTAYAEVAPTADRLRITIDRNIRSRQTQLDLRLGDGGEPLLAPGLRLMEVKTARAIPLWLCAALECNGILPTSFSKYGHVYEARLRAGAVPAAVRPAATKGGILDACRYV